MEEQNYDQMKLLKALETGGFTIFWEQRPITGFAYFKTLQLTIPIRIDFDAHSSGMFFIITLGAFVFRRPFPYRDLLSFPLNTGIIMAIILRTMFYELGDELSKNFKILNSIK